MENVTAFTATNGILTPATFPLPNVKLNWLPTNTRNKEDHHSAFPMWQHPGRERWSVLDIFNAPPPHNFTKYMSLLFGVETISGKYKKSISSIQYLWMGENPSFRDQNWNKHTRKKMTSSYNLLYSKSL